MSINKDFRYDINLIRAIAIIGVVLYHFGIEPFTGGFVGVDVFFVISGFLITRVVVDGLTYDRFSIKKFYLSRFRRVVPALLFFVLVMQILAFFFLPTFELKSLGIQLIYSIAFFSNIFYGFEGNYFSQSAYEQWLLHTWSLAIEFQFYILFPLLISLLFKVLGKRSKLVFSSVIICTLTSLLLCLYISGWKPTVAFYLLPTRAWEFLCGSLAFFASQKLIFSERTRKIVFSSSLIIVVLCYVAFDKDTLWPSLWTLVPVIATSAILLMDYQDSRIANNPIVNFLGLRSYSIYLWHWPVSGLLLYAGVESDVGFILGAWILVLGLSELSYRIIETPFRNANSVVYKRMCLSAYFMLIVIFACSIFVVTHSTFEGRVKEEIEKIGNEKSNYNPRRDECEPNILGENSPHCSFGENNKTVFLVGDSHSTSIVSALSSAVEASDFGVTLITKQGCPTIREGFITKVSNRLSCKNFNNELFDFIDNKMDRSPVVIVNAIYMTDNIQDKAKVTFDYESSTNTEMLQNDFSNSYVNSICSIANKNDVFVLDPIPWAKKHVPNQLIRQYLFPWSTKLFSPIAISREEYNIRANLMIKLNRRLSSSCGVEVLSPQNYLCSNTSCKVVSNGIPLYYDHSHLSEYGNKNLVNMFRKLVD